MHRAQLSYSPTRPCASVRARRARFGVRSASGRCRRERGSIGIVLERPPRACEVTTSGPELLATLDMCRTDGKQP